MIPACQRLIEQAAPVMVFRASREVRVEQRGPLPPQQFQGAAAARLGRLVVGSPLCHRNTAKRQQLRRHWRSQPTYCKSPDESTPRHAPRLHAIDHATEMIHAHSTPLAVIASLLLDRAARALV